MVAVDVGGMGSREQNFSNRLVSAYGFDRQAAEVQELYLAGRRNDAMFALPDELIDLVSIAGPRERAKDRLRAFREAGVGTLILAGHAVEHPARPDHLRLVAALSVEVGTSDFGIHRAGH